MPELEDAPPLTDPASLPTLEQPLPPVEPVLLEPGAADQLTALNEDGWVAAAQAGQEPPPPADFDPVPPDVCTDLKLDLELRGCEIYYVEDPCTLGEAIEEECEEFLQRFPCSISPIDERCQSLISTNVCMVDPTSVECAEFMRVRPCERGVNTAACDIVRAVVYTVCIRETVSPNPPLVSPDDPPIAPPDLSPNSDQPTVRDPGIDGVDCGDVVDLGPPLPPGEIIPAREFRPGGPLVPVAQVEPSLPRTGLFLLPITLLGLAMLGAGAGLLRTMRGRARSGWTSASAWREAQSYSAAGEKVPPIYIEMIASLPQSRRVYRPPE